MTVGAILTQGLGSPFGGPSLMITLGYLAGEALPEVVVSGALGGGGYVDPPGWRTPKKKKHHVRELEERADRKPVNVEALFVPPALDLREVPFKAVPMGVDELLSLADVSSVVVAPFSAIKPRTVMQNVIGFGDEDELLLILAMEI